MFHKLIALFVIFFLTFQLHSLETVQEIQEGDRNFENKNYKKALTHYLTAKKQNPNSTNALIGYGKTSLALGSNHDAKSAFEKALQLTPGNPSATAGMGRVLVQEGKLKESRSFLESALQKNPNQIEIILSLSETYEAMGKTELAIYKLENLQSKTTDILLTEKLCLLLIDQNKFNRAKELAEVLIQKNNDSIIGYRLLGKTLTILSYISNPSSKEADEYYNDAVDAFATALSLNEKDEDSLFWRVKLKLWKSNSYREEAIKDLQNLSSSYPENDQYSYMLSSLLAEKKRLSPEELALGEKGFKRYIAKYDLDEIARFTAEDFAIRFLPQESDFRKHLGQYRLERHKSERNSLHYDSSLFHIWRARELLPNNQKTMQSLLEVYKSGTDLPVFVNLLSKIVKNDPDNFKAQNKLEYAVTMSKKTLEYREGYVIPGNIGLDYQDPISSPKILLMDFTPSEKMGYKINLPNIMNQSMHLALANISGIHLAGSSEEQRLRKSITENKQSSYNPYHPSIYFDINESPSYPEGIRFLGIGNLKDDNNSLQIEFKIYDRKTGKFYKTIKLRAKGRSSLSYISMSLAIKIKEILPKEGHILKVKKEAVLINLGNRNMITKKSKIIFSRNDKKVMEGEILELGETMSLVRPLSLNWERDLATGDSVSGL